MLLTEQSTPKTPSFETTSAEKKQLPRLYAHWKLVDGQLVCRWYTS
jgi:hypothetical protein